jgi:dipeptidyl aminopeptidase/acylaminoacyl peptidase
MTTPKVAPYGSWKSPITTDLIVAKATTLGQLCLDGADVCWTEQRPGEAGRTVIVRRTPDGQTRDLTPPGFNVRTRVHEYGGGAYTVADGTLYFIHFADQHLYVQEPGSSPRLLHGADGHRYADLVADQTRGRIICVREDHTTAGHDPANTLVSLPLDGGEPTVLTSGCDFYACARLSPDGSQLAWIQWNHPNMPWDGTELRLAGVQADGSLGESRLVAGGEAESVCQPAWSPDGVLHFISDRTGWWNLYRCEGAGVVALAPMEAEFSGPQWVFGMASYGFAGSDQIICLFEQDGQMSLAHIDVPARRLERIRLPYTRLLGIQVSSDAAYMLAGSPTEFLSLIRVDLATLACEVIRRSTEAPVPNAYFSVPRAVEFPTEGGVTAHGIYYPPCNPDHTAPAGERPPLVVISHGGPTGAANSILSLPVQYWTSRGFAVLDVNYGGSSGYGRAYRQRLNGKWGVVDVDDCCQGALWLAGQGEVDGSRMAIRGGSAGGYTTLCALTFRDVFKAGASHFGVSDLAALARDTHKFESRYLDSLVGPYPEAAEVYRDRSPINHPERLSCPVIFLQGMDDKVVPPNQAELMVEALRTKGVPVAYLAFEGEGHGFRKAENIKRALEAELYFYSRIFRFTPEGELQPVRIENW